MPPGSRVSQAEVAEAIGVSRIPVRDALIALEREGIIRMEPNKGAFVQELDAEMIEDHYKLYGLIVGVAVERTTQRADDEVRAQLISIRDRIQSHASPEVIGEAGLTFQNLVRTVGGSPRMRAVSRGLVGMVYGNFFEEVPEAVEVTRTTLPRIIDAMLADDVDAAVELYVAWQKHNGVLVIDMMRRRGMIE